MLVAHASRDRSCATAHERCRVIQTPESPVLAHKYLATNNIGLCQQNRAEYGHDRMRLRARGRAPPRASQVREICLVVRKTENMWALHAANKK
jgi:hypothetical protein